jgi:hypothetical protein
LCQLAQPESKPKPTPNKKPSQPHKPQEEVVHVRASHNNTQRKEETTATNTQPQALDKPYEQKPKQPTTPNTHTQNQPQPHKTKNTTTNHQFSTLIYTNNHP